MEEAVDWWQVWLLGAVGGLIPDALRIIKGRHKPEVPAYLKHPMFWVGLVLAMGAGGLAADLFNADRAYTAIALGYAAPDILEKALSKQAKSQVMAKTMQGTELELLTVGAPKESINITTITQPTRATEQPASFDLRRWWSF
jgi:hypothetical protein